jgi:hypothetical protein
MNIARRISMSRTLRLLGVAAAVLGMLVVPFMQAHAADVVVTLAPGQTATIPLDLWCLNYGKPFPTTIEGPTARPPDEVVKVMQTALTKGTVTSDVYQTQLAIWRATTGAYKDFAGQGTTLAEEIYNDSQAAAIPAPPPGAVSLDEAVAAGTLKVTIENFQAIPVEGVSGQPFHGQADLVVENVSQENVTFVLLEGAVFQPVGQDAQALISHQNPVKPPELPVTGGNMLALGAALGGGIALLLAGSRMRQTAS